MRKDLVLGLLAGTMATFAASVSAAMSDSPPAWSARPAVTVEPAEFFRSLVARYRSLLVYEDSVRLEQRTIEAPRDSSDAAPAGINASRLMDCLVSGSTLAVRSSDPSSAAESAIAADCDESDRSLAGRMRLERHLWTLPHLSLRFSDDPLKSLHGTGGEFVPVSVEPVMIGSREYLRLQFVSSTAGEGTPTATSSSDTKSPATSTTVKSGASIAPRDSTMHLFVNPRSMLVERVEHVRDIADGVRYEATLEITPERAVPAANTRDGSPSVEGAPPAPQAPLKAPTLPASGD